MKGERFNFYKMDQVELLLFTYNFIAGKVILGKKKLKLVLV